MIGTIKNNSENNYPKAIAISVAILVGLVLLSIFYIVSRAQPQEEVGIGGIIVNYGTSDQGMGDDYMSVEEPSVDPNANLTPPDKIIPNTNPTQNTNTATADNNIVTQDNEDAVSINTKEKSTNNAPTTTKETKPSTPAINQNALYKGKKNTGTGLGDGTGTVAGNQGKPEGDPLSNSYDGTGSGNGGIAIDPKSGRWAVKPVIKDDGQESGKVVIKFRIDEAGNVISAVRDRGTTLGNLRMISKCEQAILSSRILSSSSTSSNQYYTVTFNFIVK
jgi:hypothetical protein